MVCRFAEEIQKLSCKTNAPYHTTDGHVGYGQKKFLEPTSKTSGFAVSWQWLQIV